jgi:phage gpG-like protein
MITIKIDDKALARKLNHLAKQIEDLEPMFDLFAPYIQGELDDQFKHERDVYGVNWQPLKPETISQKRKAGKMEKIMQRDGYLRDSAVTQAMKQSFVAGFDTDYGEFHHSKIHRAKGVPRRRLLPDPEEGLPKGWQDELEAALGDFLKQAWQ